MQLAREKKEKKHMANAGCMRSYGLHKADKRTGPYHDGCLLHITLPSWMHMLEACCNATNNRLPTQSRGSSTIICGATAAAGARL